MKKTFRIAAMLLALLLTITSFAFMALAENESSDPTEGDSSSVTESSGPESSNTESSGDESNTENSDNESDTESSDTESSEPETSEPDPNAYTVNIAVSGADANAVNVYFNDELNNGGYFGSSQNLNVKIEAQYGFKITAASFGVAGFTQSLTATDGVYTGTYNSLSAGYTYTLSVTVEYVPIPATLAISAFGATGYTVSVGGEVIDLNSYQLLTGTEVKIDFAIDGEFKATSASLTINGNEQTVTEPSVTFVITGNTDVLFLYGVVPVTFTLNGPGALILEKTSDSSPVDTISNDNASTPLVKTLYLTRDVNYKVYSRPGPGYEQSGIIAISEPRRDAVGDVYYFVPSGPTTVSATFKASDRPPVLDCTVQVNVYAGGKVVAGNTTIMGGTSESIVLKPGETITFTVIPDADYAVDVFRVGGAVTQLTDNQYTISSISSSTTVSVVFINVAPPPPDDETIGVDDIDWSLPNGYIDITDGKVIRREVFDKIATLAGDGKYVEFRGVSGSFYIPYGARIEGSATHLNLTVSPFADQNLQNAINSAGGSLFAAYSFKVGALLPEGTLVSFNLGAQFANQEAVLLLTNGNYSNFYTKENAESPLAVSGNGISGRYAYDNESILIVSKEILGGHIINSTVINAGGGITPSGIITVNHGLSKIFYVTAQEGYVIKQILIDGVAVEAAVGQRIFNYTFENVTEDHMISAEFEPVEGAIGDLSDGDDDSEDDGSYATIIVILIVALVAVAGAAALFIVKWRQEKF